MINIDAILEEKGIKDYDWNRKEDFQLLNRALRSHIYESPTAREIIDTLKANNPQNRHPRLLLDENKLDILRKRVITREPYQSWMTTVLKEAERHLAAPMPEYVIEDNIRLLYVNRKVLGAVSTLAFAYLITNKQKNAEGAVRILMTVCGDAFPDWNPYHFLDTAEMAAAVALGYDWCYHVMTPEERAFIKKALIEKTLVPVMEDYNDVKERKRTFYWSRSSSHGYPQNWLAVCFGGTTMAVLAIGDEDLGNFTSAGEVIVEGMERVKDWQETYMPDGACYDGTMYWEYAMSYMVYGASALKTALGTDYGMMDSPAMEQTFVWLAQMMGPDGAFNLDSNVADFVNSPEFFWYSAKSKNPSLANYRLQKIMEMDLPISYKDILWYEPSESSEVKELSLDYTTRGIIGTTVMRSGYDSRDTWLALYSGGMNTSIRINQVDIGTFVLDMLGTRWALDLGTEHGTYVNLSVPRNHYYRFRAEGHNTVILNPDGGCEYDLTSARGIEKKFLQEEASSLIVFDFSSLLAFKGAKKWYRGARLNRKTGSVTIQDELEMSKATEYYWFTHTEAEIVLSADRKRAVLTKGDKQIEAHLISPDHSLVFEIMDAVPLASSPNPKQEQNTGVQKLTVHQTGCTAVSMAVEFVQILQANSCSCSHNYTPLSQW